MDTDPCLQRKVRRCLPSRFWRSPPCHLWQDIVHVGDDGGDYSDGDDEVDKIQKVDDNDGD